MPKILVGSTNPGKARELAKALADLGVEVVMPADVGLGSVEETGKTFEENAILKAKAYAKMSGLVTLADDSGLEIDVLGGAPGVYSRRWAGEDATDLKLAVTVMERMKDIPTAKRTARLTCVVAIATPKGEVRTAKTSIEGRITEVLDASKIAPGLPYRPLLEVEEFGKLYSDLTEEEHESINHRRRAVQNLLPEIKRLLGL